THSEASLSGAMITNDICLLFTLFGIAYPFVVFDIKSPGKKGIFPCIFYPYPLACHYFSFWDSHVPVFYPYYVSQKRLSILLSGNAQYLAYHARPGRLARCDGRHLPSLLHYLSSYVGLNCPYKYGIRSIGS